MSLTFEGLRNVRDLGGHPAADGRRTRPRTVYRADLLAKMTDADWLRFAALDVRLVIDLRYPWEIERSGRVRDGSFDYVNLSIEHRPYDQASLGPDVGVVEYLAARFAEVAADGVAEIAQAIRLVAHQDAGATVLHCTSGKDRTGLLVALLFDLVGVADDDIAADFALTNAATAGLIADWQRAHPGREITWPGYATAPEALIRRVLDDLRAVHGSVEAYATGALGLDRSDLDALRGRLLTDRA